MIELYVESFSWFCSIEYELINKVHLIKQTTISREIISLILINGLGRQQNID